MKRTIGLAALAMFTAAAGAQCPPPAPGADPAVPDVILLRVWPYANPQAVLTQIEQAFPGIEVVDAIEVMQTYKLIAPPGTSECDIAIQLFNSLVDEDGTHNPNRPLAWAELDYAAAPGEGKTGTIYIRGLPNAANAYQTQFAVNQLGLPAAHSFATGAGVAVAVLDTGIDATHPALAGKVNPGFNFITNSTDTSDVARGADSDADGVPDEMVGHGTFVAGLISLTAPDAKLLPVVVLDSDGRGELFTIAKGIHYAIDRGVEVINMSLGSTYKGDVIEDAIDRAEEEYGIVVVSAAGSLTPENLAENPATSDGFGVAAVDAQDRKGDFSKYHVELFLSAPGANRHMTGGPGGYDPAFSVYSTLPGSDYGIWEGTSFATPFVSAAAALLRSQHPEWDYFPPLCDDDDPQTPEQFVECIETRLADTAVNIDSLNPGYAGRLGEGRLNIAGAVGTLSAPTPGDLDNDGDVDLGDLSLILADYGEVHSSADLNANGVVDLADLAILFGAFGQ